MPFVPSVVIEGNFASTYRVRESSGKYSTSKKQGGLGANTPPHITELVIQVLGAIDLDLCADDGKRIRARQHYTGERMERAPGCWLVQKSGYCQENVPTCGTV